jgi:pimeloyl-ACP methyl ester carboxylesterase
VAFLLWAVTSTTWLANSMRTRGVDGTLLRGGDNVEVADGSATLAFLPASSAHRVGLIFFCGGGVAAQAYAPLLRPLADAGYPVFIVKLPYRLAPLASHKSEAIARARHLVAGHRDTTRWVIAGHSLGAALAARMAHTDAGLVSALVLIGTTHPKEQDLSILQMPVTKIYGTNDGVAPAETVLSNARLLPRHTKWVAINGGNHSQFGHYGHQLFDGDATISREAQQALVRSELMATLELMAK